MSAPLSGRRVVVTRPVGQAQELVDRLTALGADVVALPLTRIVPITESPQIAAALRDLARYDVIVVTSANGATCFADQIERAAVAPAQTTTIAAVGQATADALTARGLRVDLVPPLATGGAIVAALAARGVPGLRVLLPRARAGRPELSEGLRAAGAVVDDVALYDTMACQVTVDEFAAATAGDGVTIVVTAPSGIEALAALVPDTSGFSPRLVTIGPTTSAAARRFGFEIAAEASEQTAAALVVAVCELPPAGR